MREQLQSVSGVVSASVDYASKTVTVKVKKGTDPKDVAAGLTGQYSGTLQ